SGRLWSLATYLDMLVRRVMDHPGLPESFHHIFTMGCTKIMDIVNGHLTHILIYGNGNECPIEKGALLQRDSLCIINRYSESLPFLNAFVILMAKPPQMITIPRTMTVIALALIY